MSRLPGQIPAADGLKEDTILPVHGINYKDRPEDAARWLGALWLPTPAPVPISTVGLVRLSWLDRDVRFYGAMRSDRPLGAYPTFRGQLLASAGPLASALFTEELAKRLKSMRRAGRLLQIGADGIVIAMITGKMSMFAF